MRATCLAAALAAAFAFSAVAQQAGPEDKHYRGPGTYSAPPATGDWQAATTGGQITLFDRRHFQGILRTLTGETPDFERLRINDAAASLVVRQGTWELCTDAHFRGECRIYGPGQYEVIPDGHDDAYSSARPVVRAQAGAWGRAERGEVRLYDRRHFQRPLRTIVGAVPDFEPYGFNDAIASLEVIRGTWEFCTDAHYQGECRVYGPGQYPEVTDGLDDRYSSARPVAARPAQRPWPRR